MRNIRLRRKKYNFVTCMEGELPAEKSQLDKFKEAARQLETDDDEERFNENLRKLAKQKPKDEEKTD